MQLLFLNEERCSNLWCLFRTLPNIQDKILWTFLETGSIADVWQGFEYASESLFMLWQSRSICWYQFFISYFLFEFKKMFHWKLQEKWKGGYNEKATWKKYEYKLQQKLTPSNLNFWIGRGTPSRAKKSDYKGKKKKKIYLRKNMWNMGSIRVNK